MSTSFFSHKHFTQPIAVSALTIATLFGAIACQTPEPPVADVTEEPSAEATSNAEAPAAAVPDELTPVKFTLSWLLQGVDAPLMLAMDRGYFAEEGIEVSFERGYGSAGTASTIAAGQYDIGFGDMYSMIEFNQQNPNDKLIAVAVAYNKAPFALISFKDSGINSIPEMTGKKLGAPIGDAPRRLWPVLAEQVGVDAEGVEWVTMEPKLRQTFLLQGQVDAISGFSYSMLPAIVGAGKTLDDLNIFYYTDNGLDLYGNVILVKESFAEANPDVVKGFVKGYLKGMQDALRDPEAGLEGVLAAGDELMDQESEKLRLQIALDGLLVTDEVEKNGLGAADPVRLEATIAQTVKGFGLAETPTVEEVFNDSFLPPLEERQVPPASERKPL
ncbi:MAG: ABC transporter substrate-binding protein [Merismopedia sp. SIO2A8]|nr:ABC transporter substrate-binding protein [Merismopedia sp. SIO2A8]